MDHLFAVDPADDGDVPVYVFERDGDGWRQIEPKPQEFDVAAAAAEAMAAADRPEVHRWSEKTLTQTAQGWVEEYAEGEFTITPWQREVLAAQIRRLVDEGKLFSWTNADTLTEHIRRARL